MPQKLNYQPVKQTMEYGIVAALVFFLAKDEPRMRSLDGSKEVIHKKQKKSAKPTWLNHLEEEQSQGRF